MKTKKTKEQIIERIKEENYGDCLMQAYEYFLPSNCSGICFYNIKTDKIFCTQNENLNGDNFIELARINSSEEDFMEPSDTDISCVIEISGRDYLSDKEYDTIDFDQYDKDIVEQMQNINYKAYENLFEEAKINMIEEFATSEDFNWDYIEEQIDEYFEFLIV